MHGRKLDIELKNEKGRYFINVSTIECDIIQSILPLGTIILYHIWNQKNDIDYYSTIHIVSIIETNVEHEFEALLVALL